MSQVTTALDSLAATEAEIVEFNNSLKPGYYVGEPGPDGKAPPNSWLEVMAMPPGLPPILTLGATSTRLQYLHGNGLYVVWAAQTAEKVPHNKASEIYAAARSGNYNGINGA